MGVTIKAASASYPLLDHPGEMTYKWPSQTQSRAGTPNTRSIVAHVNIARGTQETLDHQHTLSKPKTARHIYWEPNVAYR